MNRRTKLITFMASCSLIALGSAAYAEDAAPVAAPQEDATVVVVTAQKREQKLQDVPMAITVAGAAQLERQQVTVVRDLDRISPAISFVDGAPGGGASIRGIGTQTFSPSAQAAVGIVVDNVPQGNVNTSNIFDMDRVEVLRGPQGMLFGQSASAGVINMTTKAPKIGDFSGRVHADLANNGSLGSKYGEQVVQGVVNIPLTDTSAMRVSAFRNYVRGVERDAVTGEDNKNDTTGIRLRYLNDITPNLKMNLIVDYAHNTRKGNYLFVFRNVDDSATAALLAACGVTPSEGNNVGCAANPTYSKTNDSGASLQFDYTLGDYTLTSITAFRQSHGGPNALDITNLVGADTQLWSPSTYTNFTQTSQELRLNSPGGGTFEWTAGVYLARQSNNNSGTEGLHIIPAPFFYIDSVQINHFNMNTAAAFGQVSWKLTDKLSTFAGVRATKESLSDEVAQSKYYVPALPFFPPAENYAYSTQTDVDNLSGRIGIQYAQSADLMYYATLARGYKSPQINDTVFGVAPSVIRPEIPTAFEIGAKGMVGRVGVDVNLFYTKVQDYQGQKCFFNTGGDLVCGSTNVPEVITKGIEIDLFGKPMRNLTLNGGFIYNPVTYPDGYIGSDGTDLGGTQMTGAPETKFTLSGEYAFNLPGDYKGFVNMDTTYKSKIHMYPSSEAAYDVDPHWITGAQIGVKFPDGQTSLKLYARNIGNTPDPINIYPSGTVGSTQIVGQQGLRVVGISLDKSF